jgi:tripartite-type tricarboxylate transporter receptor subunit TctC
MPAAHHVLRSLSAMLALAVISNAAPLAAQSYPAKALRLVVPTSTGGVTDVVARLVAPRLASALGEPVIVENRVGAGGVLGTEAVARAAPDGYTLLAVLDSFTTNPYLFKNVPYDVARDFAPISLLVRSPQVVVVHPQLGVRSFSEFVAVAKARGPALNCATAGPATSSRLTLELMRLAIGIDPTAIHHKGGSPAMNDLLGGQVDMMIVTMGLALPYVKAGKLIAVAVTSGERSSRLPDVATVAQFYPGFESQSWAGVLAPAGTPREIVSRLNVELAKALAETQVKEALESQGYEIVASTPEAFAEWIRVESTRWGRVIRERGIELE